MLGWLVRIDDARRAGFFTSQPLRSLALLVIFFGTSPVFSAFNQAPGMQVSMANMHAWGGGAIAAIAVGAAVGITAVVWHLVLAKRTLSRRGLFAYLARQVCIVAFYACALGAATAAHNAGQDVRSGSLPCAAHCAAIPSTHAEACAFLSLAAAVVASAPSVHRAHRRFVCAVQRLFQRGASGHRRGAVLPRHRRVRLGAAGQRGGLQEDCVACLYGPLAVAPVWLPLVRRNHAAPWRRAPERVPRRPDGHGAESVHAVQPQKRGLSAEDLAISTRRV